MQNIVNSAGSDLLEHFQRIEPAILNTSPRINPQKPSPHPAPSSWYEIIAARLVNALELVRAEEVALGLQQVGGYVCCVIKINVLLRTRCPH